MFVIQGLGRTITPSKTPRMSPRVARWPVQLTSPEPMLVGESAYREIENIVIARPDYGSGTLDYEMDMFFSAAPICRRMSCGLLCDLHFLCFL